MSRDSVVGKTKEKLPQGAEKKTEITVAAIAEAQKAEPPKKPAMVKRDSLVLTNGQTVSGQILERRPDGVWFRADEGIDMLFTHAEIKQVRAGDVDPE